MSGTDASPSEHVERCARCHQPPDKPVVGNGQVAGEERDRIPVCIACLAMVINEPRRFWDGMRERQG
jgi:hypothetical protein